MKFKEHFCLNYQSLFAFITFNSQAKYNISSLDTYEEFKKRNKTCFPYNNIGITIKNYILYVLIHITGSNYVMTRNYDFWAPLSFARSFHPYLCSWCIKVELLQDSGWSLYRKEKKILGSRKWSMSGMVPATVLFFFFYSHSSFFQLYFPSCVCTFPPLSLIPSGFVFLVNFSCCVSVTEEDAKLFPSAVWIK